MKRKNPAPDRRVQRTQKALREALLQLLKTCPLQKIAVTKLCEQSDLNRTTFYTYYSDPTDLFNSIVDEVIERLEAGIRDCFATNSFAELFGGITQRIFEDRELFFNLVLLGIYFSLQSFNLGHGLNNLGRVDVSELRSLSQ